MSATSWHAPAETTYLERLPALTKAGDNCTKTHSHVFAPCDVCWEATWVAESELKVTWTCSTCKRSSKRNPSPETPVCVGRTVGGQKVDHPPTAMTISTSGRACRMTYRCPGRHRREGLIPRTKETT